jgi:hypothetical protein
MQGVCPAFGHGYPVERDRASSDREGRFGAKHSLNAPNHTAREKPPNWRVKKMLAAAWFNWKFSRTDCERTARRPRTVY